MGVKGEDGEVFFFFGARRAVVMGTTLVKPLMS